jgi:hypothetical protein
MFSYYSFLVNHPVKQDDRHLIAHAMAFDSTVAWQPLRLVFNFTPMGEFAMKLALGVMLNPSSEDPQFAPLLMK